MGSNFISSIIKVEFLRRPECLFTIYKLQENTLKSSKLLQININAFIHIFYQIIQNL